MSPEQTGTPAGTVVEVAPDPQGIVYDPVTDSVAIAVRKPDRLLVLDPTTLKARMTIALPGKSRHLQLATGGGSVLVPSETANTLIEVDLATGSMTSTPVGEHPHNAATADNGDVLVGNEFDGSLSVVRDGEVVHTFDDLQQPGGAVADDRTMVVVDVGTFTVSSYDLDTLKRTARISGGAGPTHASLVGPGKLVVADTRSGAMLVFADDPLEQVGSLALGDGPYGADLRPADRDRLGHPHRHQRGRRAGRLRHDAGGDSPLPHRAAARHRRGRPGRADPVGDRHREG